MIPTEGAPERLFSADKRINCISFTGSPHGALIWSAEWRSSLTVVSVGWQLGSANPYAKVVLELGGNAACVVDEGADIQTYVLFA